MCQLKLKPKIRSGLKSYIGILQQPSLWLSSVVERTKLARLILIFAVFAGVGIALERWWPFPYFYGFASIFLFIGMLGLWATAYFSRKMRNITAAVANQPAAKKANIFYFSYCQKSWIYFWGPWSIIIIFGVGAISIFGALQLTPTLLWMVILFSMVVYISIIGYIQYIVLAIYISNFSHGSGEFKYLPKSIVEYVPIQLEWIQELTRLSHTYRSAFFTLGSAYTIAFGAFCWLPKMQTNSQSPWFFLLWGIILIAIVLLFPIISVLEYQWIKRIVEQLKIYYIHDLTVEKKMVQKIETPQISPPFQRLVQILCATQILNSSDYPIKSTWETGYAAFLSLINLLAALASIIQGIPTLGNVFPHVF